MNNPHTVIGNINWYNFSWKSTWQLLSILSGYNLGHWFHFLIYIFILYLYKYLPEGTEKNVNDGGCWLVYNSDKLAVPVIFFKEIPYIGIFIYEYNDFLCSVQFSLSVVSDSLRPHEPQHTRPPCPSPTPGVHSDSRPSSQWCHPAISSSVIPFSSRPQSFPASGSFQMSPLFASGGQSIGVGASTSVLPMNTQDWSLGWTDWISLQSKGL